MKADGWQVCEAMGHYGPECDPTVSWRDLGLMCDACYAAYGDTRPLREALELIAGTDPVDAALDPARAIRVAKEALR